ncbi:MAG: transporter [Nonlabens sp.]|jgi:hypothetical protein|uniref:transporter n=1 Tax=Nonlabens sp. TaxID=1888209 RepID=UPI00321B44A8
MKKIQIIALLLAGMSAFAQSDNNNSTDHIYTGNRPDGHAPINVMGDHTHAKGEFMVSYRFATTTMEDLRRGSDDVSFESVLRPNGGQYMVTPTEMSMNMHMLGAMYAPTDRLTLMAMTMYMDMSMEHLTAMGGNFTTTSSGLGDTSLSALYKLFKKSSYSIHGQLGISLPTGGIDNEDVTPASMGNEVILPYPMQIGSGTYSGILAFTYLGQSKCFSWGSQVRGEKRFGENDNGYTLGDRLNWNNWAAYKATDWLSISTRIEAVAVEDTDGVNPDLNPLMVITADTANSGGTFLNGGLGVNLYAPTGSLKGFRLGLEYSLPLAQQFNGVQLKNQDVFTAGVQYAF